MKRRSPLSWLVCILLAAVAVPTALASAAPIELNGNLISNPGAELGASLVDGYIHLDDWAITNGPTDVNGFFGVPWGQPSGFPLLTDPGPEPASARGTYFFAGGANSAYSSAAQLITGSTSEIQSAIDGGTVPFELSGWLGGFTGFEDFQEDNAVLAIRFLDAANDVIGTAAIGPVTNADRNNQTGLLLRQETGFVPSGTRSIGVELQMTRTNGVYNDGYADNLSLVFHAPLPPAQFNIFQWKYVDPQDPSQGKLESTSLAKDGFGLHAAPGLEASGKNLTKAFLIAADLTNAVFSGTNLTDADLSQANLMGARFTSANLTNANFSGAEVRGAYLDAASFTTLQLYTTASYLAHDLTGIQLRGNNLARANLSGQNLSNANLQTAVLTRANVSQANLTNADLSGANLIGATIDEAILTNAIVKNAKFSSTHITLDQLYSTASYKNHELTGVQFAGNDLSGANLAGQVLVSTSFYAAKLVGADLTNADLSNAELINADLSHANLTGANFTNGTVALANLSGAILTGANFSGANLIGTNLTGADIRGASLSRIVTTSGSGGDGRPCGCGGIPFFPPTQPIGPSTYATGTGITLAQLATTASYGAHDLSDVTLMNNEFTGGDFAGFNLTNANFNGTALTGADLSGADTRGTTGLASFSAIVRNLIRPDGHVDGLDLFAGRVLTVRDYDGDPSRTPTPLAPIAIAVDQHFTIGSDGTLAMVFEANAWDSTISFAAGIPVTLGGSLELTFAPDVNLLSQIGRTFNVFDWTGVSPTGAFTVSSPYVWDLSHLFTTGQVTFLAASGLAGDFNGDNVVDAADYTVWRDGLGPTYKQAALGVWKSNFGAGPGSGGGAVTPLSSTVPEPNTFFLISVGLVAVLATGRSRVTRRLGMPYTPLCTLSVIVATLAISPGPSLAAAPQVQLTKIGVPVWKPADFQLFSAPAAPFQTEFNHVYDTLVPLDIPTAPVYTPHAPPYDTELSAGMIAGGYVNQSVFTPDAITLHPNGVYFAFMLVPDPGTTGSSRDFAAGPVIPNALFPIANNVDVWLDGVLVDRTPGADAIVPVQPRDVGKDGTSHLEFIQAVWHPWDDDLTVGPLGNYDLRLSIRDVGGSGWDIVAPFQVVPAIAGDYDGNGTVGPGDYDVWKSNFGSTVNLAADGNANHVVDAADYSIWRDNVGATLGGGGLAGASTPHATVPEPSTVALTTVGLVGLIASAWRRIKSAGLPDVPGHQNPQLYLLKTESDQFG